MERTFCQWKVQRSELGMQKAEDLEVGSWVRNWNNCCVLLKYINVCLWEKEARAIKRWRFYAGSGNGWSSCIAGSLKKCLRKNHADFCCCSDILHTLYQKLDYHSFFSRNILLSTLLILEQRCSTTHKSPVVEGNATITKNWLCRFDLLTSNCIFSNWNSVIEWMGN